MKKSTLWNGKIFAECVRRTWIPAVMMFLTAALCTCLIPIDCLTSSYNYYPDIHVLPVSKIILPANYLAIIMPVFLLSFLFSHLNSKKATDFYHSLPVSRTCYFLTSLSVVLMWSIAIFAVSFTVSACLYMSIYYFKVILSEFVLAFLGCVAISMLSAGAYLIAKALSGTWFSNLTLTIILLLGPRAVISVFTQLVSDGIWIVEANNVFALANPAYNLLYAGFTSHTANFTVLPEYVLYTSVLAVIFLVCAYFLHRYRKSEMAESSAPNGIMRHIFAITVTFAVSMSLLHTLLKQMYDSFVTPLLIVICIVCFWAVETIFSKSFKKGLVSMPFIGVVIALDLLFAGGVTLTSNYFVNFAMDETNIKGISISGNESISYQYRSYAEYQHLNSFVQDKEFIKEFSEEYESTISAIKDLNGKYVGIYGPNSNNTFSDDYTFSIQLDNGTVVQRKLRMNEDMREAFEKAVENTKNIASMLKLPTDTNNMAFGVHFIGSYYVLDPKNWTQDEYVSLYEIFRDEYSALSDKDKLSIISVEGQNVYFTDSNIQANVDAFICAEGLYNHEVYQSSYAVIRGMMPKTYERLYELAVKYSGKQLIDIGKNSGNNVYYFSVSSGDFCKSYDNSHIDCNEVTANVWEFLKNKDFENIDLNKPIGVLSYYYSSQKNNSSNMSSYVIFNITEEEKEKLNTLIPEEDYSDEEEMYESGLDEIT